MLVLLHSSASVSKNQLYTGPRRQGSYSTSTPQMHSLQCTRVAISISTTCHINSLKLSYTAGSDLTVGSSTSAMMTGHHAFSMQHAS